VSSSSSAGGRISCELLSTLLDATLPPTIPRSLGAGRATKLFEHYTCTLGLAGEAIKYAAVVIR
jgi:hypothetical protein